VHREVAGHIVNDAAVLGISPRAAGGPKCDRWELLNVEKVVASQVLVAFRVIRVEAVGLDRKREPAVFGVDLSRMYAPEAFRKMPYVKLSPE
jgi:hypothetical protein